MFSRICKNAINLGNKISYKFVLSNRYKHSNSKTVEQISHTVHILPAAENNYMYILVDVSTKEAAVIDPIDPDLVRSVLDKEKLKLTKIFTTHHLADHDGGNPVMQTMYPKIPIYGGDKRVKAVTKIAKNGDLVKLGTLRIKCLFDPQTTSGHVCYYVRPQNGKEYPCAFVGDTLFVGGMGDFTDSNVDEVYIAIHEVIAKMPEHCLIFPGHENTIDNIKFAASIDKKNPAIEEHMQIVQDLRSKREPTVPAVLMDEKTYNPFLRIGEKYLQEQLGVSNAKDALNMLRKKKKQWASTR